MYSISCEKGPTGSVGKNSTFSEHRHLVYQIKENHEYSNMVETILPTDHHPQPWGWGQQVKILLFRTRSCCISN